MSIAAWTTSRRSSTAVVRWRRGAGLDSLPVRFGTSRLVWSAIEHRLYVLQLDPAAFRLLQVSLNVLKDPAAVREFLNV